MKDPVPDRFEITLRRSNGRFVRSWTAPSRYKAKKIRDREEERHDDSFYIEITPVNSLTSITHPEVARQ